MFKWFICKIKGHDVEKWLDSYMCRRCESEVFYEIKL